MKDLLNKKSDKKNLDEMLDVLDLRCVLDRNIEDLSGGELQRFAIAMVSLL